MKYQEDFVLEKKYLNLIEKSIYNTVTGKFGMITGIEITGLGIQLKAYYDCVYSDEMVFFEDFGKGLLKFVIVTDISFSKSIREKYEKEIIEDVKLFFGDKFTEDMIMICTNEEYKTKTEKKKQDGIKEINGRLGNLEKLSSEIFYDNYTTVELYKRYSSGAITETEMLYGACNHLCKETKRLKDDNLNYFIEKFNHEQAEFLVEYFSRKKEVEKKSEKVIQDKEHMFKVLDNMIGTEEPK